MRRVGFLVNIMEFQARFADEAACLDYLAAPRWLDGFTCPAWGGRKAWVLARRHLWGVRGVWPADLGSPRGRSWITPTFRSRCGSGRPTWWPRTPQGSPRCSCSGSWDRTGKALVAVAVEVRGTGSGRIRLQGLPNAGRDTLLGFVQATIAPAAIVHTDRRSGYGHLAAAGYDHRPAGQHYRLLGRTLILPRAHRAISNLKTWIAGTHHGTSARQLQVYLDEFTFRHNRRRTPIAAFQTLLGLGTRHSPATYRHITT